MRDAADISVAEPLRGHVAIVTGAGRGVGRAIAEGLAAAGAVVAVAARSPREIDAVTEAIIASGGTADAFPLDVTDGVGVRALVEQVEARHGPPSLLVNNAGTWDQVGPLAEADTQAWWRDVEVNLKGTFLCTRAVLPGMLERRAGRIVNICSYAGAEPRPYATAYAAAKAAVLRLTDSLAAELEGSGVLAFAVTPGFVRTKLVDDVASSPEGRRYFPALAEREDALEPSRAAELCVKIAAGRLDPLAGRLLHVLDDLDALMAGADAIRAEGLYTLRLRKPTPQA